tara:strand:- start:1598 stop:3028 length:1431 start_codon:yes stop_codon:yes gene_type:complete
MKRFKPQYLPHNQSAQQLVEALAIELGLRLSDAHKTILSSFLFCVQEAGIGASIIWSGGTTSQDTIGFSFFPATGAQAVKNVRARLVEAGYLTNYDELPSGFGDMSNREAKAVIGTDKEERIKSPNSYHLNPMPLFSDPRFASALFVDAQRPYMLVNKPEAYTDKVVRKAGRRKAPKLSWKAVYKGEQGAKASVAARAVKQMNAYWAKHPLTLPATNTDRAKLFASATRIFHDGSLIKGGRWYGGWTSLKSDLRLQMHIDNEPVCEIDLNGSQPTLFSALLGVQMNVGGTWTDVYDAVVQRLKSDEESKLLRKMVKQVIVEMLGTGNHQRTGPADTEAPEKPLQFNDVQLFFDTEYSRETYLNIQRETLEVFPALRQLDKKHLNATGYLSFHESEILTQTLITLKDLDVVAYGVHDCVMVRKRDRDLAVETYRQVIKNYVAKHQRENKHPHLNIEVSLTIEEAGMDKVKLPGCYLD